MHRPTELPEWMADAVTSLCALSDEDPSIRSSITKAVGQFRKSHQDMWEQARTYTRDPETPKPYNHWSLNASAHAVTPQPHIKKNPGPDAGHSEAHNLHGADKLVVRSQVRMTWTEDQLRLVSESSGTQSYFS